MKRNELRGEPEVLQYFGKVRPNSSVPRVFAEAIKVMNHIKLLRYRH